MTTAITASLAILLIVACIQIYRLTLRIDEARADAAIAADQATTWASRTIELRERLRHCQPRDPKTGRMIAAKSAHTAPHSAKKG
jgi:hypothetical protein